MTGTEKTHAFRNMYAVYNRKSTDDANNQKNSLTYQLSENLKHANKDKLQIAQLTIPNFCENGIINESHSGFKESEDFAINKDGSIVYKIERPKFARLVALLKSGELRGVIFLCWDRASRNKQDDVILKKLIKQGSDIRFSQTSYERTSSGDLHMDIDGMFSSHYSRVISEKVKLSSIKLRAEGRCLYMSPIGYLDNGSATKPMDPERAPLVKRIFELYATGEWSLMQLAKWAQQHGLTTKPCRRKRKREEILSNMPVESMPKLSRPVNEKSIENILSNPFYIGKNRVKGGGFINATSHRPLIDSFLYNKVQEVLKARNVSIRYTDDKFTTYRAIVRCSCYRAYCGYVQKGKMYYRARCRADCDNPLKNLTEAEIHNEVQALMDRIYFSDDELRAIEAKAHTGIDSIAQKRDRELDDLNSQRKRIFDDLDYLTKNRITLLRTNSMSIEGLKEEEDKLATQLADIDQKLGMYTEAAQEMLKFVIAFSELVKNASLYYKFALDTEKRDIVSMMFTELVFKDRKLFNYTLNEGFGALFRRSMSSGAPDYVITELQNIYPLVKASAENMKKLLFLHKSTRT